MFKVGDEVRYVKYIDTSAGSYPELYKVYTVLEISNVGETDSAVYVKLRGDFGWWYDPDSFELIDDHNDIDEEATEYLLDKWQDLHDEYATEYRFYLEGVGDEVLIQILEEIEVIEFIMKHMGIHVPTLEDYGVADTCTLNEILNEGE